jgi:predicted 3-demethylubiquinone-9 3-methyltransferase (glyoxalase superfamily)
MSLQKQKIKPFLWFDTQAEEAAKFYTSIFQNSQIVHTSRYGESAPAPAVPGSAMSVSFILDGLQFLALNGGPMYKFSEATSFLVMAETQEEIDDLWGKLTEAGQEGPCGWLKDRFGVSWQVTPPVLGKYLSDGDAEKATRVMKAMLGMGKIIIADLEAAYEDKS